MSLPAFHLSRFPSGTIPRLLLASAILLSGCAQTSLQPSLVMGRLPALEKVRDRIHDLKLPIQLPKPGSKVDAPRFLACMAPLSAHLLPGLRRLLETARKSGDDELVQLGALDVLDGDSLFSEHPLIAELLQHLADSPGISGAGSLTETIKADLAAANARLRQRLEADTSLLVADTRQATRLSKTYLLAYFRRGGALAASGMLQDEAGRAELQQQVASILHAKTDDPRLAKILELVDGKSTHSAATLVDRNAGFIGRDGTRYGFPGVAARDGNVTIDHSQIAADTLRIVLEALRDTFAPLPVLAESTAASLLPGYAIAFDGQGKGTVRWAYDRHDPAKSESVTLDAADFQTIEANARKAEASVAGAVGKAIRGGSWGSLNNEAVAKLVETAAGVVARHMTERAEWCLTAQTGGSNTAKE